MNIEKTLSAYTFLITITQFDCRLKKKPGYIVDFAVVIDMMVVLPQVIETSAASTR